MANRRFPERFKKRVPTGDVMHRMVCGECGYVHYDNPKVVVGSVATWEDRILLCRRAIEPRKGFWTLPAGFLELNESPMDGARREAWEEALAEIQIDRLLAVYAIVHISQVQLMYRARLVSDDVAAGPESLEVGLFRWTEIPWEDIAFPSVHWALGQYNEVRGRSEFAPFTNPPGATGHLPRRR